MISLNKFTSGKLFSYPCFKGFCSTIRQTSTRCKYNVFRGKWFYLVKKNK